jgi:hypothetical protein
VNKRTHVIGRRRKKGKTAGEQKKVETKREKQRYFAISSSGQKIRTSKQRKVAFSLSTPRGRIGEWKYSSTHSQLRHQMEMSGSIHAPAALPPVPIQNYPDTDSFVGHKLTVYPLHRKEYLEAARQFDTDQTSPEQGQVSRFSDSLRALRSRD